MAILNHIPKKKRELANNLETTIAGVAALDAAQGKVLKEFAEHLFHVRWVEKGEQVNLDSTELEGRFYAIGDGTKGTKPFGYGTLIHVKTTETDLAQLAFSVAENKLAIRYTNNGMTGWSTWSYVAMMETLSSYVPKRHYIESQQQLDQVLNNTTAFQDNSIYEYCLYISVGGLTLSGGTWYVKGFRLEGDRWGWQQATCYDNQFKMRSKTSGTWGNWVNK